MLAKPKSDSLLQQCYSKQARQDFIGETFQFATIHQNFLG
jgi:hypothetical protein